MNSPNKENLKKWRNALEQSQYTHNDSHSCPSQLCKITNGSKTHSPLGVACELAGADGILIAKQENSDHMTFDSYQFELPPAVQDWLGIKKANPLGRYDLSLDEAISAIDNLISK